jgi:hypothetical protein
VRTFATRAATITIVDAFKQACDDGLRTLGLNAWQVPRSRKDVAAAPLRSGNDG